MKDCEYLAGKTVRSRTTGKDVKIAPAPNSKVDRCCNVAQLGEAKLLGFDKTTKSK